MIIGITVLILLGVGWLARAAWLPLLLQFLDVTEEPHNADYIVVLGMSSFRTQAAIDLYNAGYAPRIILCGCGEALEGHIERVEAATVPSEALTVNRDAQSTWEEAEQVLAVLRENNARSALIVTDSFHSRRSRATYARLQQNPGLQLTFVASANPIQPDNWWQTKGGRAYILNEYPKLAFYLLRYGVWPL